MGGGWGLHSGLGCILKVKDGWDGSILMVGRMGIF